MSSTAVDAEILLMLTVSVLPSAVPVRIGVESNAGLNVMVRLVVDEPVQLYPGPVPPVAPKAPARPKTS
jgi:hypothetical protein